MARYNRLLTVNLDRDQMEAINAMAKKNEVSRSVLVRTIFRIGLINHVDQVIEELRKIKELT